MSRLAGWVGQGVIISDGAWGTEFQKMGLDGGEPPDFWNLKHPERVLAVARGYIEAGSEVLLTNTFRANGIALPETGDARLAEINRAGVEISRRAAGDRARVVASIGPGGKVLMMGEVTPEQVYEAFLAQAAALAAAGPDALLVETMSDPEEALLALQACRETGLPVIVSFAFDSGRNKDRTMMGSTPEVIAARMRDAGADAVGANCGAGVEFFPAVCRRLKDASGLPVWIKANAGLPVADAAGVRYETGAQAFAAHLPALIEAGASFAGGCCGTSPDFIRALKERRSQCVSG